MKIPFHPKYIGLVVFFALLSIDAPASGLSDAMSDWDPGIIQGPVMELGRDYVVVSEKKIALVDVSLLGKRFRTAFRDINGKQMDRDDLKKGAIILAKGSIGIDDKSKGEVLYATEIYILKGFIDNKEGEKYKGLLDKPLPPR